MITIQILLLCCIFSCAFSETGPSYYDLCPHMVGTTTKKSMTGMDLFDMGNKVRSRFDKMVEQCGDPSIFGDRSIRAACYAIMEEEYGIVAVDKSKMFPFLSYDRTARTDQEIKLPALRPNGEIISARTLRVAYLLLAHKDFTQVSRLIKAIYSPNHLYVIHVDARNTQLRAELSEFIKQYSNISLLSRSFAVYWGGIEMIYATLESAFALLDAADWDFMINLSGQDYPICSDRELCSFLSKKIGSNFDGAFDNSGEEFLKERLRVTYFASPDGVGPCRYREQLKTIPETMHPYGTSQWFAYSREFVEYIRSEAQPVFFLSFYETAVVPDEGYMGTVLMNSPFKETRVRHHLHYSAFEPGSSHAILWKEKDIELITSKEFNACFARKFDRTVDEKILDLIDQHRASKKP